MELDSLLGGMHVTDDGSTVLACIPPPDIPLPPPVPAYQQFSLILPTGTIDLTADQARQVQQYHQALVVLGPAGVSPLKCGGGCPTAFRCPLAQMRKAPEGQSCPFEVDYVRVRFAAWLDELGRTPDTLLASERSTVANLVYIDVQEQRCLAILSKAENAAMVSRSVRDVDENGKVVCWEDVIHINRQILDGLNAQRRGLLRDFELTPEAKTKKRKVEGVRPGSDLSSRMSQNLDKLRDVQRRTITVAPQN